MGFMKFLGDFKFCLLFDLLHFQSKFSVNNLLNSESRFNFFELALHMTNYL